MTGAGAETHRREVSGDAFEQATGLAFAHVDFTYAVNVVGR
ncbi:MAG: hypothetical protein ACR2KV_08365 [Solirubrobacteraceae bacterium]